MDQDIKSISLLEDNYIDIKYAFEYPLDIDKESLTFSANPTTKITSSGTCKPDDTSNIVSKRNTRNKTKKQSNKVGTDTMGKKLKTKKLNLSN